MIHMIILQLCSGLFYLCILYILSWVRLQIYMYSYSPDSTCLCKRQMGYCSAAYYSTDTRPIPATYTQCSNPTDLSCVKNWSGCVKGSDEAAHGRVSYSSLCSYMCYNVS